ncbi:NADPH-dependent diflavin oxidoreductase 1 [Citrus sinensis]|nr:NADPH-dependent diflavin oxidoreductase 1 [Citrus sinensis]
MREEKRNKLLIFYASQTGNALDAAERIGRESERRGCPVVVRPVDDYDARCLPEEDTVIFVVSTTGQGDTPDSMKVFWRFLLQKSLSKQWLEGVRYAVFGLGDSGYQKFNFVAKKLDNRLLDLGATAVVERGLGDDQHPSGYEGALDPWMRSLWRRLHQIDPSFFPQGPDHVIEEMKLIDQPKVHITYHSIDNAASRLSNASDLEGIRMQLETARSMSAGKLSNYNNKAAIEYEVGDVLEVLPSQDPAAVDTFIQRCNLDPDALITVMSYFATAEHEKERLQYFASPEGRDDLYKYNQKERRTVLEVLEDFPSVQMPFDWLVQLVPPLKTRAFSISSSPLAHPNQVHLTVSVVSWTTPYKRKRTGLCSAWLAGLDPQQGIYIPAWFQKGSLPRPPPSVPLILIGPGTGCAPFRGFVEERAIQSSSGPAAPIIFFFGCRNEDDFLYRELWLSHSLNDGVFPEAKGGGFYVAFSRKQPQKVYVQHKMLEQSQRIWNLLLSKASIYVAGSATKMPSDVWSTFEEIVSKEGEASRDSAANWLKALQRAGRYHVEAWS